MKNDKYLDYLVKPMVLKVFCLSWMLLDWGL